MYNNDRRGGGSKNRILGRNQAAYQLYLYTYFTCLSVCLYPTHPQWIAKIVARKGARKAQFLRKIRGVPHL